MKRSSAEGEGVMAGKRLRVLKKLCIHVYGNAYRVVSKMAVVLSVQPVTVIPWAR